MGVPFEAFSSLETQKCPQLWEYEFYTEVLICEKKLENHINSLCFYLNNMSLCTGRMPL